jgi:hypothetical protein
MPECACAWTGWNVSVPRTWGLREVKQDASVKDVYIEDAAVQRRRVTRRAAGYLLTKRAEYPNEPGSSTVTPPSAPSTRPRVVVSCRSFEPSGRMAKRLAAVRIRAEGIAATVEDEGPGLGILKHHEHGAPVL